MSSLNQQSIQIDEGAPTPNRRKRPVRAGVIVSLVFHTTAIVALIVVPYLIWLWMLSKSAIDEPQITIIAEVEQPHPEERTPRPVRVVTDVNQVTATPVREKIQEYKEESDRRPDDEGPRRV